MDSRVAQGRGRHCSLEFERFNQLPTPSACTVAPMKFDWNLLIGSLCMLVFLLTRWTDAAFLNGLGVGLGLTGIVVLVASIYGNLNAKKRTT